MPTKRERLTLNLEPGDVKVLDALDASLKNMSKASIGLAALRIGLLALRDNPERASTVGPLEPEGRKAK